MLLRILNGYKLPYNYVQRNFKRTFSDRVLPQSADVVIIGKFVVIVVIYCAVF